MPIFMAFLSAYPLSNRLDNGTTDDRPGIRPPPTLPQAWGRVGWGLCVSRRSAIHFRVRGCPGLTGPQAPKRDGGEGGQGSKTPPLSLPPASGGDYRGGLFR